MKSLFLAAAELETFLIEQGWRYCFIGGIALQRWGQPRLTNDIDLTILAGFGNEAAFVDALLGRYHARIPDGRDFALSHRVLLLESQDAIPIDVALGGIAFEDQLVSRATRYEFLPDVSLLNMLSGGPDRPQGIRQPAQRLGGCGNNHCSSAGTPRLELYLRSIGAIMPSQGSPGDH
jgi:hypothetical protein